MGHDYAIKGKTFAFDHTVAPIFDDMAIRSIPMYIAAHKQLSEFALCHHYANGRRILNVLDIGASTGTFLAELMRAAVGEVSNAANQTLKLYAHDNSPQMMDILHKRIPWTYKEIVDVTSASYTPRKNYFHIIAMMYLLQFLPFNARQELLRKAYNSLTTGGVLVLGQKFRYGIPDLDRQLNQRYHNWRMSNGYTVDEIYDKTVALQSVMQPNTEVETVDMLEQAGFRVENVVVLTKFINFSTLVAIKT